MYGIFLTVTHFSPGRSLESTPDDYFKIEFIRIFYSDLSVEQPEKGPPPEAALLA